MDKPRWLECLERLHPRRRPVTLRIPPPPDDDPGGWRLPVATRLTPILRDHARRNGWPVEEIGHTITLTPDDYTVEPDQ